LAKQSVHWSVIELGQIDYANPLELMKPYRIEERELSWLTQPSC